MKFRKKPVVIEAFRFLIDEVPQWWSNLPNVGIDVLHHEAVIETLEGTMRASLGDWIIKGVKGELYPCKPDIFDATYEKVEE
jgi:hypothetical protein